MFTVNGIPHVLSQGRLFYHIFGYGKNNYQGSLFYQIFGYGKNNYRATFHTNGRMSNIKR